MQNQDHNNIFNDNKKKTVDMSYIKEILTTVNVIEILENEYDVNFETYSNGWYNACCPFPWHQDLNPSFGVNEEQKYFNCFGCNERGDILNFISKMEGLSFYQSVQRFYEITGIANDPDQNNINRSIREINNLASEYIETSTETALPNGVSLSFFLKSVADRLRSFEINHNYSAECIAITDDIYREVDKYMVVNDEKKLNMIWKSISQKMKTLS